MSFISVNYSFRSNFNMQQRRVYFYVSWLPKLLGRDMPDIKRDMCSDNKTIK